MNLDCLVILCFDVLLMFLFSRCVGKRNRRRRGRARRKPTGEVVGALPAFQLWYNVTRPHQHLQGQTPQQAWLGVDPLKTKPRSVLAFSAWGGRLRGMVLRH